jgi:hypothetical protein
MRIEKKDTNKKRFKNIFIINVKKNNLDLKALQIKYIIFFRKKNI